MADTMIERMAELLAKRHIMKRDGRTEDDPYVADWVKAALRHSDEFPSDFIDDARAVIAAMREPTDAMLSEKALFAGFCHDADGVEDNDYHDRDDAKGIWQGMIDAALAEEG